MLRLNVRKKEDGFTLMETMITVIVAGIFAAISAPSLLGMYNRSKVTNALEQVQGALEEARRQAMRKGQSCEVQLDTTTVDGKTRYRITTDLNNNGCLLEDRLLPEGVTASNSMGSDVAFSIKGNSNDEGVIALSGADGSGENRCLVMSTGTGIIRTGIYNTSITSPSPPSVANCIKP